MKHSRIFESCIYLLILITFASAMLLSGCSDSSSKPEPKSTSPTESKSPPTVSGPPAVLKVKGLYLGMPIDEAIIRCNEGNKSIWIGSENMTKYCKYEESSRKGEGNVGHPSVGVYVEFSDNKAKSIKLTDMVFDARDMQASDFAQKFISAYGIPELKPSDDRQYWQYITPSGTRVKITANKNVIIDYGPKGSFN